MNTILLKRRLPQAIWASRPHGDEDAGIDLVCCESKIIWPHSCVEVDTGWDIKIPDGFWGSIKSRSSTFAKRKLMVLEGIIDPGYTGRLSAIVFNTTFLPKKVNTGDRLIQLIIVPMVPTDMKIVTSLPRTSRGRSGFGSTDVGLNIKQVRKLQWQTYKTSSPYLMSLGGLL